MSKQSLLTLYCHRWKNEVLLNLLFLECSLLSQIPVNLSEVLFDLNVSASFIRLVHGGAVVPCVLRSFRKNKFFVSLTSIFFFIEHSSRLPSSDYFAYSINLNTKQIIICTLSLGNNKVLIYIKSRVYSSTTIS